MMTLTILLAATMMANPEPTQGLAGSSRTEVVKQPFDARKWRLAWSDEFSKAGRPDTRFWSYEEGFIRNNEAQYYTKDRPENARIENGRLIIEARLDNWQGRKITSASLTTRGKRPFLYGRIEARVKVPTGRGTWPAVWTLGENIGEVGWPKCGELDIMEYVGYDPERIHANVHVESYNHTKGNGIGNNLVRGKPYEDFNVYADEWTKDRVDFFYNDERYLTYRNDGKGENSWPFDKPQYVILNLAIGGAWGGQQGIDETKFPHRMEVDYVRYYVPR